MLKKITIVLGVALVCAIIVSGALYVRQTFISSKPPTIVNARYHARQVPIIDAHSHITPAGITMATQIMDANGVVAMVNLSGGQGKLAIRQGKWKLIDGQGSCGYGKTKPKPSDPPMQLYNLEKDLGETTNLYTQYPEIVQHLKQTLEEIKAAGH